MPSTPAVRRLPRVRPDRRRGAASGMRLRGRRPRWRPRTAGATDPGAVRPRRWRPGRRRGPRKADVVCVGRSKRPTSMATVDVAPVRAAHSSAKASAAVRCPPTPGSASPPSASSAARSRASSGVASAMCSGWGGVCMNAATISPDASAPAHQRGSTERLGSVTMASRHARDDAERLRLARHESREPRLRLGGVVDEGEGATGAWHGATLANPGRRSPNRFPPDATRRHSTPPDPTDPSHFRRGRSPRRGSSRTTRRGASTTPARRR